METRYTPGPAVNVTLSELPTGWPSTSSSWLVVLLNAWRSKSFSGFDQFAVTVILWTAGSVPVTVMMKLSQVELVQSADTGSDVDSVNGPPPHVSVVLVGVMVPLEGVAAFRIGGRAMKATRKNAKMSSAGTGWTRFGAHIGDLRRRRLPLDCLAAAGRPLDG